MPSMLAGFSHLHHDSGSAALGPSGKSRTIYGLSGCSSFCFDFLALQLQTIINLARVNGKCGCHPS